MPRAVLITIAVLLGGCATTGTLPQRKPQPADATLAAHGLQCHEERATGSLIAAVVCTTPAERARAGSQLEQNKEWLSNQKAGPDCGGAPCH